MILKDIKNIRNASSPSAAEVDRKGTEKQTEALRAKNTIWSYIHSEDYDSVIRFF